MENFTLLYTLGEGYVVYSTYGKVVKAINKTTGTPVAIKKFKNMDNNTEIKKIALREIKILKRLSHPNIVNLLDVILINNRISIVFEFVESTVFEILKSNPMGIDQKKAKKLIYQLLLGLDHCHRMGIVHRDIKPENLLVSEAGTLKICDFGFARQYKSKETMTQYVSTRWYRAPELLLMAEYGLAVDVWAVGCVLAELLTGKPLFPGKNDYDTLNMIVKMCGNIPSGLAKSFKSSKKFLKLDVST
jgi:cyclin-dependent kinase-like